MVALLKHLGRSVRNRPHFFIALFVELLPELY